MALLFAITLFISALLLFWVQPLIAKILLPMMGGTPAVWNTCMLFFQGMLLAGYAYVLITSKYLQARWQIITHGALLCLAALYLPVGIPAALVSSVPAESSPVLWLLGCLLVSVGLPFFALSASAPLLQKWISKTRHPSASDPYFLYAASNAGSLLALIAFPLVLERHWALKQQSGFWAGGYVALALLIAACAIIVLRATEFVDGIAPVASTEDEAMARSIDGEQRASVTRARRWRWTALAFIPSSLVLGVTTYISTDIAAAPLLWVIPLILYLLTYILAFAKRSLIPRWLVVRALRITAIIVTLVILSGATEPAWFLVLVHLTFFFVAALLAHGQLADDRPSTAHLAEFYLWIAIGGVLGGIFNALIAPVLFDTVLEYPLVIVLACLALQSHDNQTKGNTVKDKWRERWLDIGLPLAIGALTAALAVIVLRFEIGTTERLAIVLGLPLMLISYLFTKRPLRFALGLGAVMLGGSFYIGDIGQTLYQVRNFYGTLRVTLNSSEGSRRLHHGSTIHGRQFIDPTRRCEPLSYYHRTGPLGAVLEVFNAAPAAPNVAVVGLGTGATVAYTRPEQHWTFYEINPAVLSIARDSRFFSYLQDCNLSGAPVETILGDARLRLQEAPNNHYGLIVLDAFSSDAIPLHLLTREALDIYLSKLASGGLLAFHISNRHLSLHPVLGDLAQERGLTAFIFDDTKHDPASGKDASEWVVVARRADDLGALLEDKRWTPLKGRAAPEIWTDDFSDIISVFKWRG